MTMDEGVVRQLAQLQSLIANMNAIMVEVEGMKIANAIRLNDGYSPAYNDGHFDQKREDLDIISHRMRNEI